PSMRSPAPLLTLPATFRILPTSRSLFIGIPGRHSLVMSIPMRAAREPPKKVLPEPVIISKIGAKLPQVGAIPRSLARTAGIPPISTLIQPAPTVGPRLGIGTPELGG